MSAGLVGAFLLFVAAINAMLAFGGVESIVTRENEYTRVHLTHGRAWMWWPTRVHVRDASIRIDSYTYEFQADVRAAVVDIRLLSLLHRRFEIQHIDATGVDAMYRRKVTPKEANDPKLAAFPPFENTPPEVKPSEPKPRKDREDAWGIDLDDVEAELDSLWVDEFNTVPCGRVHGGLHWTDGYEFEVTHTTVELVAASLWLGDREALRGVDGLGNVELAPFETSSTPGDQVPSYLSFDIELQARVHDPEALAIYAPSQVAGRVDGGDGPLAVALHVDDGVFQPGSAVHYRTDRVAYAVRDGASVRSTADVLLEVTAQGHPRANVEVTDARLVVDGETAARVPLARASLTADRGSMYEPWTAIAGHGEAPEVRVDALRGISRLHPTEQFAFTGGSASGRVLGELDDDGALVLSASSRMRSAAMRIAKIHVTATGTTRSRVRIANGGHDVTIDRVRVALDGVTVRSPKGKSTDTWTTVDSARIRVHDDETTITMRGKVEDARPALIHFTRLDPLVKALPDLALLEPVEVEMEMRLRPHALDFEIARVEQLGLKMQGWWRLRGHRSRGAFLFSGTAAVGFAVDDKGLRQVVPAGDAWLRERLAWVRSLGGSQHGDAHTPAAGSAAARR